MLKRIAAILLATALSVPAFAQKPSYLASIRPLQALMPAMLMTPFGPMEDPDSPPSIRNICTTTSINERGYWLTAAHCVSDLEKRELSTRPIFIDDHPADVIEVTYDGDMAILHTEDYSLPAVKLAKIPPTWLDKVVVAGHPFGLSAIFVVPGTVANPFAFLDGDPQPYMLFSMPVAGGNSGSCVFDKDGKVVSVVQIGLGPGYTPVSGGAPYWYVRQFAGKYFSK